jgi:ribonuclease HII
MRKRSCIIPGLEAADPSRVDTFHHERLLLAQGYGRVAGADEVGRGPLAGPVVACCVILPPSCDYAVFRDSKTLTHSRRTEIRAILDDIGAAIGTGIVPADTIDSINIHQASLLAMRLACEDLVRRHCSPDFILVDGKFTIPAAIPQQALVKGDSRSASIAAASIAAKVSRDAMMADLHHQYPEFRFDRNKGYPTRDHRRAIILHGPCPQHRRTFKGVREFV